jgi:hypothetical protein
MKLAPMQSLYKPQSLSRELKTMRERNEQSNERREESRNVTNVTMDQRAEIQTPPKIFPPPPVSTHPFFYSFLIPRPCTSVSQLLELYPLYPNAPGFFPSLELDGRLNWKSKPLSKKKTGMLRSNAFCAIARNV